MKEPRIDPFTGKKVESTKFTEWMEEVGLPVIRGHNEDFLSDIERLMWLAYRRGLIDGAEGE